MVSNAPPPPVHGSASQPWLRELAARASTLGERIAGQVGLTPADGETTERRLAVWSDAVGKGDGEAFDSRLRLDGLDRGTARLLVGDATPRAGTSVPAWARQVGEAVAIRHDLTSLFDDRALRADDPIPAQELALPFLKAARAERDRRGARPSILAEAAVVGEERHLVRQLSAVLEALWDRELAIMRDQQFGRLQEVVLRAQGWTGREHHDRLAWTMLHGLDELLEDHPALARQLGTVCDQWVTTTVEFRERLEADRAVIVEQLGDNRDPGQVVETRWGVSDPHRGGRTVVLVRFASGLGVVYKPKSLAAEVGLGRLIDWLNAGGFTPALATLHVVDRSDHGWVQRVEQQPVPDHAAADRYYERAGGLLALMRALDGSDCHHENVVAAGEHPYLIDAETLLQPRLRPPRGERVDGAFAMADREISEGVLGVGLLPVWFTRPGAQTAVDVSGLGRLSDGATFGLAPQWEGLGTDLARRTMQAWTPTSSPHDVVLDGEPTRCEDHEDALVRGYTRAHDILVAGRDDLLGDTGLLAQMRAATVRVVLRGTWLYGRTLETAQQPRLLGDGVDRSMHFEQLCRPLLTDPDPSSRWPMIASEHRALEGGDVPLFETRADATELRLADGAVALDGSALENATYQLRSLDAEDLERQTAFIRASLAIRRDETVTRSMVRTPRADPLAGAVRIGELLRDHAIRGADGSVTWVGAFLDPSSERVVLQPPGPGLYEGLPGIALFLSALVRVDGPGWRDLALAALRTAWQPLERDPSVLGIGGATGVGGAVYALTTCAELLDDRRWLDQARTATTAVARNDITSDQRLDLMAGSAGLVLGMLALHGAAGDERALERARWAGDHLVDTLADAPEGGRAWRTLPAEPPHVGMAHGASGGALALARLAAITGERHYADAAEEAVRFEHRHRCPASWVDRRQQEGDDQPSDGRWCWGAAGIGLARIGILRSGALTTMTGQLESDLSHAATSAQATWPAVDHLCCGGAGVAEFARALGEQCPKDLGCRAEEWASTTAGRILADEPLRFAGPPLGPLSYLGLYQGLAGVGYALLGFEEPRLPSPLAWL